MAVERPNPITDFVLAHVTSPYELHARTAAEGAVVFRDKMTASIRQYEVDEEIADTGGTYRVYTLVSRPGVRAVPEAYDLVLGRFRAAHFGETPQQIQGEFQRVQEEHDVFVSYFGPRHVPHTEFITVDNLDLGDQDPEEFIPDREYLMVQEMVFGEWYSLPNRGSITRLMEESHRFTDELRVEGDSYAEAYHRMQVELLQVPEYQIVIDTEENHVFNGDTNDPIIFREVVQYNSFFRDKNIDTQTIQHPRDLFCYLTRTVDELRPLADMPWGEARDMLYHGSLLELHIVNNMAVVGEDVEIREGFGSLIELLDLFPPDESENRVILQMRDMGIASPQRPNVVVHELTGTNPDDSGAMVIPGPKNTPPNSTPRVEGRGKDGTIYDLISDGEEPGSRGDENEKGREVVIL